VAAKWIPPDLDNLIGEYESGDSPNLLARRYGVSRKCIVDTLRRNGIAIRSPKDAYPIPWAPLTAEDRSRRTAAAHAACANADAYDAAARADTRVAAAPNTKLEGLLEQLFSGAVVEAS